MSKEKINAVDIAQEVLELPAEEVPHVRTVEQAIKPDIVVFDKYQKRYDELQQQYGSIKINGIDDTDGYNNAKIAVRELRTTRTSSEKDRTSAKSFYLECGRAIDKKAEWIEKVILSLETPIKNQIIEIDNLKEKQKQEKIKAEILRAKERVIELTKLGVTYNGAEYVLDELSFSEEVIRESGDDYFNEKIIPQFKEIFDAKEKIRIANKNAQDLIDAQIEKDKEDFIKAQQKLADDQKKIDEENRRIATEKEKTLALRTKSRANEFDALGMVYNFQDEAWQAGNKRVSIVQSTLVESNEQDWEDLLVAYKPLIAAAKKALQEEQDAAEKVRTDKKLAELKEDEQKQKDRDELKKKEEAERATDKQKVNNFIKQMNALEIPIVTSRYWRDKLNIIREKFEEINAL